MCFGHNSKNTTTTKQNKTKHTNTCQSRESNPGPLAPQSNALHLYHPVN